MIGKVAQREKMWCLYCQMQSYCQMQRCAINARCSRSFTSEGIDLLYRNYTEKIAMRIKSKALHLTSTTLIISTDLLNWVGDLQRSLKDVLVPAKCCLFTFSVMACIPQKCIREHSAKNLVKVRGMPMLRHLAASEFVETACARRCWRALFRIVDMFAEYLAGGAFYVATLSPMMPVHFMLSASMLCKLGWKLWRNPIIAGYIKASRGDRHRSPSAMSGHNAFQSRSLEKWQVWGPLVHRRQRKWLQKAPQEVFDSSARSSPLALTIFMWGTKTWWWQAKYCMHNQIPFFHIPGVQVMLTLNLLRKPDVKVAMQKGMRP